MSLTYVPSRAYALTIPPTEESPEHIVFGFAPRLADYLLSMRGWRKWKPKDVLEEEIACLKLADPTFNEFLYRSRVRTDDEIAAAIEGLFNPSIDMWGCRICEAQHKVVSEAALTLPLDDLYPWYRAFCPQPHPLVQKPKLFRSSDDPAYQAWQQFEWIVRDWITANIRECSIKHSMLDMMIEYDRELDAPGLVEQIKRQIDEDCDY